MAFQWEKYILLLKPHNGWVHKLKLYRVTFRKRAAPKGVLWVISRLYRPRLHVFGYVWVDQNRCKDENIMPERFAQQKIMNLQLIWTKVGNMWWAWIFGKIPQWMRNYFSRLKFSWERALFYECFIWAMPKRRLILFVLFSWYLLILNGIKCMDLYEHGIYQIFRLFNKKVTEFSEGQTTLDIRLQ